MVGAGIVLDIVQHWEVFETINEIFILVPALLGLKGNLEMTLASRLSTQVCFVYLSRNTKNVLYSNKNNQFLNLVIFKVRECVRNLDQRVQKVMS